MLAALLAAGKWVGKVREEMGNQAQPFHLRCHAASIVSFIIVPVRWDIFSYREKMTDDKCFEVFGFVSKGYCIGYPDATHVYSCVESQNFMSLNVCEPRFDYVMQ